MLTTTKEILKNANANANIVIADAVVVTLDSMMSSCTGEESSPFVDVHFVPGGHVQVEFRREFDVDDNITRVLEFGCEPSEFMLDFIETKVKDHLNDSGWKTSPGVSLDSSGRTAVNGRNQNGVVFSLTPKRPFT